MLKVGHRGYLLLSQEFAEPRWREALVVEIKKEWVKTLVQASQDEISRMDLGHCRVRDRLYCLVEAQVHQLRLGAPEGSQVLECQPQQLMQEAKVLLDSEVEPGFATASDPGQAQTGRKSSKKTNSSSSSSTDGSASGTGDLLANLKKSWLGGGIPGESVKDEPSRGRPKEKKRFSLIEGHHREKAKSSSEIDMETVVKLASQSKDPLQGLLALQLVQSMQEKTRKGRRGKKSARDLSSGSSNSSSSSTSSTSSRRAKGHARAVEDMRATKKKMFKRPLHYVKKYVRGIQRDLGAEDKPFRVVDYTKKISFGKQRNLQRCHYLFGVVLEHLLKEDYAKAALQVTLCLQALHQAAIDSDWQIAWLLTHVADPFEKKLWGGDATSLQHVTAYVRSMHDLARNTDNLRRKGHGKGDEEPDRLGKSGKGDRKGNKQKDNKDQADQ